MAKSRPKDKHGKFLSNRQIAAKKAARKRKTASNPKQKKKKSKKKKGTTMAKKKGKKRGGRRRKKSSSRRIGPAIAAAGWGYARKKHASTLASLPTIEAIGGALTVGLAAHFAHKANIGGKYTDAIATGLLCVGAYEAGLSDFDTKKIAAKEKALRAKAKEEEVEGDEDDEVSGGWDDEEGEEEES